MIPFGSKPLLNEQTNLFVSVITVYFARNGTILLLRDSYRDQHSIWTTIRPYTGVCRHGLFRQIGNLTSLKSKLSLILSYVSVCLLVFSSCTPLWASRMGHVVLPLKK